jgi:hypothetical protein
LERAGEKVGAIDRPLRSDRQAGEVGVKPHAGEVLVRQGVGAEEVRIRGIQGGRIPQRVREKGEREQRRRGRRFFLILNNGPLRALDLRKAGSREEDWEAKTKVRLQHQ